jgi:hypothetical protein
MSNLEILKNNTEGGKKFIESKVSPEHYTAEACIVWCFDARFAKPYNDFLKSRNFSEDKVDAVKGAGGAQALAAESGSDHETFTSQIAKSIKLHHTDRVILMVHMDCGGYGGSKAFNNDHQMEWEHHVAELEKAAAFVHSKFPEIKYIETWIADLDGVHEVDEITIFAGGSGEEIAQAVAA